MAVVNKGDLIKIIHMDGEPHYSGRTGIVDHVDDAGQIHGSWGGLAVNPDIDDYEVVK